MNQNGMPLQTRIMKVLVVPEGEAVFSSLATEIEIEDEGAGEYLKVTQTMEDAGSIFIMPDTWPAIRDTIDKMHKELRGYRP